MPEGKAGAGEMVVSTTTEGVSQDALNARAARGLVRARAAMGIHSRAGFARMIREWTLGQEPTDRTYQRWETGMVQVPAWVFPVVAELSKLPINEILEMPPSTLMDQLQQETERTKRVLAGIRQQLLTTQQDLQMIKELLVAAGYADAETLGVKNFDHENRLRTGFAR